MISLIILIIGTTGSVGLLVKLYLDNKKPTQRTVTTPEVPFKVDYPKFNDVEERYRRLKGTASRLNLAVLIIAGVVQGYTLLNSKPLKTLPSKNSEIRDLYLRSSLRYSLTDLEILQNARNYTIFEFNSRRDKVCSTTDIETNKYFTENYIRGPLWLMENQVVLKAELKNNCFFARSLAKEILRVCSDLSCVGVQYSKLQKFLKTNDGEDLPDLNIKMNELTKYEGMIKDVFSYVGWYLKNKEKK